MEHSAPQHGNSAQHGSTVQYGSTAQHGSAALRGSSAQHGGASQHRAAKSHVCHVNRGRQPCKACVWVWEQKVGGWRLRAVDGQ